MGKQNFQTIDGALALQKVAGTFDADNSFILTRSSEHSKATFRYAGNYTPVAAPTDTLMIQGSATTTLRVKRIALWGATASAVGTVAASLIRRSTKFTTQGTAAFTAITPGKMDTGDAAATGVVSTIGTANFTSVGTPAGNIGAGRLFWPIATTTPPYLIQWDFATRQDKALILRGVTDFVFLNLAGGTIPTGGTIDFDIEIEEDQS